MQQFVRDLAVLQPGVRGFQTVGHADVRFHAKIPVVVLLGRRHLGVAGLVLGRGWRVDDRRIDRGARAQGDPLVGQMRAHISEDRFGQPVPFQQVAEVQDGCLIRDVVVTQFDPRKTAHRLTVMQRQCIPVLQEINPLHFQRQRWMPAIRPGFRIVRSDQSD